MHDDDGDNGRVQRGGGGLQTEDELKQHALGGEEREDRHHENQKDVEEDGAKHGALRMLGRELIHRQAGSRSHRREMVLKIQNSFKWGFPCLDVMLYVHVL